MWNNVVGHRHASQVALSGVVLERPDRLMR
jgi:hypothetical protein